MTVDAPVPSFEVDTALEPRAPGLWRAVVPEHWFVGRGPNGGLLAALATRAMIETVADPDRPPRSLTVHFLAAPAAGPLDVRCVAERVGRATTALSLRLEQEGRPVALGLGACMRWRTGEVEWRDGGPPEVPPPSALAGVPHDAPGVPAFMANYDMRWAIGSPAFDDGAQAQVGGWIRTAAPRPADPILLAALSDAWAPAAFLRLPTPAAVPTLDLTVHWRAPTDPADPHPWVLGVFSSRHSAGGVWEEDGELWSTDGGLLAQSRQLAIVRGRAAAA